MVTTTPSYLLERRIARAAEILATGGIQQDHQGNWWISSQSTPDRWYRVSMSGPEWTCTCADTRGRDALGACKHLLALEGYLVPSEIPVRSLSADRLSKARGYVLQMAARKESDLTPRDRALLRALGTLIRDILADMARTSYELEEQRTIAAEDLARAHSAGVAVGSKTSPAAAAAAAPVHSTRHNHHVGSAADDSAALFGD